MIILFLATFLGLLIGSFLNVVIYRIPQKQSIIWPPSGCGNCGNKINHFDNIPIFSWLNLRGKCRNCQGAISLRYPCVEAGSAIFFAFIVWKFQGISQVTISHLLLLLAFFFLAAQSICLALIDIDTQTLPNALLLPSYGIGFFLLALAGWSSGNFSAITHSLLGMAALWLIYFLIAIAFPGGMGFGDVKLAGLLGLFLGFLGWDSLISGAFAAFILGGIFSVLLLALGKAKRSSGIPFGPWMLAGAWVGIFFGGEIAQRYLSIFGLTQSVSPH